MSRSGVPILGQKYTSTLRPVNYDNEIGRPFWSGNAISGAGVPTAGDDDR